MAKEAAPSAIEQSLVAMNQENNQRMLAHVLMDPDVEAATRQVSRSMVQGAVTAFLVDEGAQEELGEQTEQYAQRVTAAAGRALQAQLEPAVSAMVRVAMRALAESLRSDIGPAIHDVMRENVAPTTRMMATQATLGVTDALTQTHVKQGGRRSLLGRVQSVLASGITLTQWVAAVLGAALLGLVFWIYKLTAQTRQARAESERREAAMLLLTQAIKSTEGKPWSSELLEAIRSAIRDGESAEYLRDLLQRGTPGAPKAI